MKWIIAAALFCALGLPAFAQPAPPAPAQRTPIATYCWSEAAQAEVECGAAGTSAGGSAVTPVVTSALANTLVVKASAGTLYSVYATNLTGGASGFLQIYNLAAAPADGANQTPVVCVPFSGGVASANYQGLPPAAFSAGITAVVSSASTCLTKTTGLLTAFISGLAR